MKKTLLSSLLLGVLAAASAGAFVLISHSRPDEGRAPHLPDTLRQHGAL